MKNQIRKTILGQWKLFFALKSDIPKNSTAYPYLTINNPGFPLQER